MNLCIAFLPLEDLRDAQLDFVSEQLESTTAFLLWLRLLLDYFLFNLFFCLMLGLSNLCLGEDTFDFAEDVLCLFLDVFQVLFSVHEELLHGTLRQVFSVLVGLAVTLIIYDSDPVFPGDEYPILNVVLDHGTCLLIAYGAVHPGCLLASQHLNLVTVVLGGVCHVFLSDVHICEDGPAMVRGGGVVDLEGLEEGAETVIASKFK